MNGSATTPSISPASGDTVAIEYALMKALDRIHCGVIVTSASRRPVFINAYAQRVLSQRNALMLVDGVLHTNSAEDTRLLQSALDNVATMDERTATLSIRGADLGRGLSVHVLRLRDAVNPAAAILYLCDPTIALDVSQSSLRKLFGLTRAEAALAELMALGHSLERAADQLCVSIHTARTHLKRILLKTDTGRQGELLRLLLLCVGIVKLD